MCRYAQFYAFISVIELPRIPAYRPKGQITAKKKGTAVITVKSGSKTVKCKVTVK